MHCPICGREVPENAKRCPHCSTKYKVLQRSLAPRSRPDKKRSAVSVRVVCGLAAVVIAVSGIQLLPKQEFPGTTGSMERPPAPTSPTTAATTAPPTTAAPYPSTDVSLPPQQEISYCSKSSSVIIGNLQGQLTAVFDGSSIMTYEYSCMQKSESSLNGEAQAVLMTDRSLYIATGGILYLVDTNVDTNFKLSALGRGIVYSVALEDGRMELRLYLSALDQKYTILNYNHELLDFVISPGGTTVAYRYHDESVDKTPQLACFLYGETTELGPCDYHLLSVSAGGTHIYAYMNQYQGQIGKALRRYSTSSAYTDIHEYIDSRFYTNLDHTQILFYENNSTWLADSKGNVSELYAYELYPILPQDADIFSGSPRCYTLPYEDLRKQTLYYTGNGMQLYYFSDYGGRSVASDVEEYALAPGGYIAFYTRELTLYAIDLRSDSIIIIDSLPDSYSLQISPCFYDTPVGSLLGFAYKLNGSLIYGWLNPETYTTAISHVGFANNINFSCYAFGRNGLSLIWNNELHTFGPERDTMISCDGYYLISNSDGVLTVSDHKTLYFLNDNKLIPYQSVVYTQPDSTA